jgi:hypothetical protein
MSEKYLDDEKNILLLYDCTVDLNIIERKYQVNE